MVRAKVRRRQREVVAGERARIAQDLHDQLGHDLNLIALSAGTLKLTVPAEHRSAAHEVRARAAVARRVVLEALTNAVKHAPGAAVTVRLRRHADGTEVGVTNGLPGLTERVEATGGKLTYGGDEGGFHVTARVPATPPPERN